MKVVIIEDEKLSAELLQRLLIKLDDQIEVVALIDSVKKSIEIFQKGIPADLIFCDIHLADGLSFDIFSKVVIDTPIIFTTAYSEYAIKAFEVNSIDYLLKPIGLKDLNKALEKYKKFSKVDNKLILENFSNAYHQLTKQYKSRSFYNTGWIVVYSDRIW
jgi:two-component SAPR family response regulator